MKDAAVSLDLACWTVVSLRPVSQQAAVVRLIETRGARALALPGIALEAIPGSGEALRAALRCRRVVFTSPAAVEFADPRDFSGVALALGSGTARALSACGIAARQPPPDAMRSEGMLALPELDDGDDPIGLVTAPDGRGAIEPALRARGLEVRVAQVYRRMAPHWDGEIAALQATQAPRAVLVTSGEALANVLALLPQRERAILLASTAVASSERLADAARAAGFERTLAAVSPTVEAMLDALAEHAKAGAIR